MLPMKTFDDLNSLVMYGHLGQNKMDGSGSSSPELDYECISSFLLDRALREFEFVDVLFPVICSKLDLAVNSKNVLKIKACLFSICTSLVVRGSESLSHPLMHAIKIMIEMVLLWPCLNADSVCSFIPKVVLTAPLPLPVSSMRDTLPPMMVILTAPGMITFMISSHKEFDMYSDDWVT
ncbi:hypothetical protein QL285_088363 [Trifolium repens]|nr:hypothetical protein QL285_088363 [Trifolium repens]